MFDNPNTSNKFFFESLKKKKNTDKIFFPSLLAIRVRANSFSTVISTQNLLSSFRGRILYSLLSFHQVLGSFPAFGPWRP